MDTSTTSRNRTALVWLLCVPTAFLVGLFALHHSVTGPIVPELHQASTSSAVAGLSVDLDAPMGAILDDDGGADGAAGLCLVLVIALTAVALVRRHPGRVLWRRPRAARVARARVPARVVARAARPSGLVLRC